MNFNVVLDISSIIWDKIDYDANTHQYYSLVNSVSMLFEKLEKEKPKILLRNELLEEMITGFPFNKIPNDFWAIGYQVYSFLGNIGSSIITYPEHIIPDIVSIPNLIKAHYNDTTINEVNYLISKIHIDSESQNVYFTFEYLWDGVDKLKTKVGEIIHEYETIVSDKEKQLEEFFAKFKPIFKHNSKHDKTPYSTRERWKEAKDKDGFVSQLSCYNYGDNKKAQELLDKRYNKSYGNEFFYSYDDENKVYVIFRKTESNIYHGYDEYNIERIPNEIKKEFNVWKYKWT